MVTPVSAFVSFNKLVIQFVSDILGNQCLEIPLNLVLPVDGVQPDFNDIEIWRRTIRFGRNYYRISDFIGWPSNFKPESFELQGADA